MSTISPNRKKNKLAVCVTKPEYEPLAVIATTPLTPLFSCTETFSKET